MASGNIEAIGDWFKNRSYGKPAIDEFFLKMSEGLTAYLFKIKAPADDEIVISGQTSLKEYKFKMPSNQYEVLLFFTSGETVDAVDGNDSLEIELTTREISITFGYEEVVLWDYVTDNSGNVPSGQSYTISNLHDDVSNYTKLAIRLHAYMGNMNEPDNIFDVPIIVLPDAKTANRMWVAQSVGIWKNRCGQFEFSGTTVKKLNDSFGNGSLGLMKIVGMKMRYTKTLLWDYATDNAGVIPTAKGSVTLHDAIENYDELIIEVMPTNTDTVSCFYILSIYTLINGRQPNQVLWFSSNENGVIWYISGTTFEKTSGSASTTTNGLVRVYGIKY